MRRLLLVLAVLLCASALTGCRNRVLGLCFADPLHPSTSKR